jgi:hypothetical protein
MRPDLFSHHVVQRLAWGITELLGYHCAERRLLFVLRMILNVAISATCVLWLLSESHVVLADVGNNANAVRGLGFLSSPKGMKVSVLDRAEITNSIEVVAVSASPSGWDWDVMQQPFDNKWTFLGVSIWYRTRQCLIMIAATYSTALCFFICCIFAIHCASKAREAKRNYRGGCST